MRRIMWVVPVLCVGAVVNVAVAWAIAAWMPIPLSSSPQRDGSCVLSSGERVAYIVWSRPGRQLLKWHWYMIRDDADRAQFPIADPPWWSGVAAWPHYNAPGDPYFVNVRVEYASGWPMHSMRYCYTVKDPPGSQHFEPSASALQLREFAQFPSWSGMERTRALPLRPALLGFVVNTVAFAAALMVPLPAVRWWVRHRRRRRGCCTTCGYPAGPGVVCSECGAAVAEKIAAT